MKSFYVECEKRTQKERYETCITIDLNWNDVKYILGDMGAKSTATPAGLRGRFFKELVEKKLATVYDV